MIQPTIEINDITINIIYIRFQGSYAAFRKSSRRLFTTLFDYATDHGLIEEGVTKVLTLYHDNPYITDEKNLRTSVAMTVPKDTKVLDHPEIGVLQIQGRYAIGHFTLARNDYAQAWQSFYNDFLFTSDLKLRDTFPFELYVDEPPRNSTDTSYVDIYIPIQ